MEAIQTEVQRRLREPIMGTLIDQATRADAAGFRLDVLQDTTPEEQYRALIGSVVGLFDAVLYLASEVDRLSAAVEERDGNS